MVIPPQRLERDEGGRAVATELAVAWPEVWRDFNRGWNLDDFERDSSCRRATEILEVALCVVADQGAEDQSDPRLGIALEILRGLGEGYAQLSQTYPLNKTPAPILPDLVMIERVIREYRIDEWCRQVASVELARTSDEDFDSSRLLRIDRAALTDELIADLVRRTIENYRGFFTHRSTEGGRRALAVRKDDFLTATCQELVGLRAFFEALGESSEDRTGIARRAVSITLYTADGSFLAACADPGTPNEDVPLLGPEMIDGFLALTGVEEWLARN